MNTFLFVWNPEHWDWKDLEKCIERINGEGTIVERWSCGNTKAIEPGDRCFLVKVGTEPKGIVGSGHVQRPPYFDKHWKEEGKDALYVQIKFDILLNPAFDPILEINELKAGELSEQNWTPHSSGISIRSGLRDQLEEVWFNFLATQNIRFNPFVSVRESQLSYVEGAPSQVLITKYERNPFARKKCIEYYGSSCTVCGFNFEETYGEVGENYIQVHHLTQLADVKERYTIDPIKDLRPVCSNCHSIMHKRKKAFTIEEMQTFISQNK